MISTSTAFEARSLNSLWKGVLNEHCEEKNYFGWLGANWEVLFHAEYYTPTCELIYQSINCTYISNSNIYNNPYGRNCLPHFPGITSLYPGRILATHEHKNYDHEKRVLNFQTSAE